MWWSLTAQTEPHRKRNDKMLENDGKLESVQSEVLSVHSVCMSFCYADLFIAMPVFNTLTKPSYVLFLFLCFAGELE